MNKPMPKMTAAEQRRFLASVSKDDPDKCWNWRGYILDSGYGQFKLAYTNYRANRLAYWLHTRHDPGDLLVCHTCDNRRCCNPAHLFLGPPITNSVDMKSKGRAARLQGVKHGRAKLTEAEVKEIRASLETPTPLARRYGVSPSLICMIQKRKVWKHVA